MSKRIDYAGCSYRISGAVIANENHTIYEFEGIKTDDNGNEEQTKMLFVKNIAAVMDLDKYGSSEKICVLPARFSDDKFHKKFIDDQISNHDFTLFIIKQSSHDDKKKCKYCGKKVRFHSDLCENCGEDISSMWETKESFEQSIDEKSTYVCPFCGTKYKNELQFCDRCGRELKENIPIYKAVLPKKDSALVCSSCGRETKLEDEQCLCGCDFSRYPRVKFITCDNCHRIKVSRPGELCEKCSNALKSKVYYCSKCNSNVVKKYGDICQKCIDNIDHKLPEGFTAIRSIKRRKRS